MTTEKKDVKETEKKEASPLSAWEKVGLAKLPDRPTSMDYIERIFGNFCELHGDRYFADNKTFICGIGMLKDIPVTIIAQQKGGNNIKENIKRNFGMPHPEGYRKALRLMKQAEKFNRPIICFIDTPGAYCGIEAEERGQAEAIAKNLMEMSVLKTPIISIIIGEGNSGGALAIAVADKVWMLENSVYSIVSPEGFASILWKDSTRAKEAVEILKITADDLKKFHIIDKVIKEPEGGAHTNPDFVAKRIKEALIHELEVLRKIDLNELVEERYKKFREIG